MAICLQTLYPVFTHSPAMLGMVVFQVSRWILCPSDTRPLSNSAVYTPGCWEGAGASHHSAGLVLFHLIWYTPWGQPSRSKGPLERCLCVSLTVRQLKPWFPKELGFPQKSQAVRRSQDLVPAVGGALPGRDCRVLTTCQIALQERLELRQ